MTKKSCVDELIKMGNTVDLFAEKFSKYDKDEVFMRKLGAKLDEGYDCVFSFNYFPDVSRIALEKSVIYISWVYDSPHLTLNSLTVNNSCNRIFVFDRKLVDTMNARGIKHVYHMPLPARHINASHKGYIHDVSFVGNFYDGEQDQYGSIKSFPLNIRGYIDGIIAAQHQLYGADLIETFIDEKYYETLKNYINTELGEDYYKSGFSIFGDMVRKRVTMLDRVSVMETLYNHGHIVDVYSGKKHDNVHEKFHGYADYDSVMPEVFAGSKINLNITLRSIRTGIPLRVMDILGAGGFCLSNYQEEFSDYMTDGKEIAWYFSEDEMVDKVSYYLEHDLEREQIALNGKTMAEKLFSYHRLLSEIFNTAI